MPECFRCGKEVEAEDMVKVEGQEICEECYLKYHNPAKPCGGQQ